jgi:hypothetical protein
MSSRRHDVDADDDLVLVGAAVRDALVRPIDDSTAQAHVRLMVGAHRAPRLRPSRRPGVRPVDGYRTPWRVAAAVGAAAVIAAAFGGVLPAPVQDRLAAAAASIGVTLPGRHDGGTSRVSTPDPPVAVTAPTTTVAPAPTTIPAATTTPVSTPVSTLAPTTPTLAAAPTTAAPPTLPTTTPTTRPASPPSTAPPPPSTVTTAPSNGCVNPALVSVTATLIDGGQAVWIVIRTTGTVPYMSATVAGVAGVVVSLQPTADGFQGTATAPTPIPAGSILDIGSCNHRIRGSATVQAPTS